MPLELTVNGDRYDFETPALRTLAEALREDLGLTGTKIACGEGHCGACTVMLDGVPTLSCITLAHAFVRADALQCGFCTPGQIVSAAALVDDDPEPGAELIRHRMAGNLCRCGAYPRIEEAIRTWRGWSPP